MQRGESQRVKRGAIMLVSIEERTGLCGSAVTASIHSQAGRAAASARDRSS